MNDSSLLICCGVLLASGCFRGPDASPDASAAGKAQRPAAVRAERTIDPVSATELADQLVSVYRSTTTHQEEQTWTFEPVRMENGTLTRPSRARVAVAFDRPQQRLRIHVVQEFDEFPEENDEFEVVVRDGRLYYRSSAVPQRYLSVELPEFTYSAIAEVLPILDSGQPLPVLALLLASAPLKTMTAGEEPALTHSGDGELLLESSERNMLLRLQSGSNLVRSATLQERMPTGDGNYVRATSHYRVTRHESLAPAAELFEFATGDREPVQTFVQLFGGAP